METQRPNIASNGFTLIELSIVLVIIGLIAGGVLVGRDLIRAAEIRTTISQIDSITTAVHTFNLKYNCLPGDCANANSFGLGDNGDGDGKIADFPLYCTLPELTDVRLLGA